MAALISNVSNFLCRRAIKQGVRTLYSPGALNLHSYLEKRAEKESSANKTGVAFREEIKYIIAHPEKTKLFTDHLITMAYSVRKNNEDDMKLFLEMIKRFCKPNERPSNHIVGNVCMLTFYHLDKTELALEFIKNPEYSCIFDKRGCFLIVMDLLFDKKKYDTVLEIYNLQQKFAPDCDVLAFAACYKINTKESFEFTVNLLEEIKEGGHYIFPRGLYFVCALAINQNNPSYALDLLSLIREDKYFIASNLRMMALSDMDRVEEVFMILKSITGFYTPEANSSFQIRRQLFPDCLLKIKSAIERSGCHERIHELMSIKKKLTFTKKMSRNMLSNEILKKIERRENREEIYLNTKTNAERVNLFPHEVKPMKERKALFRTDDH